MFILKNVYISLTIILLIFAAGCLVESSNKKSNLFSILLKVIGVYSFSNIAYGITLFVQNQQVARLLFSLYFVGIDILLYTILKLIMIMEEYRTESYVAKVFNRVYESVCLIDGLVLLVNVFMPVQYDLMTVYEGSRFIGWLFKVYPLMHVHFALCGIVSFQIVLRLIYNDIIKMSKFYCAKYVFILISFVLGISAFVLYILKGKIFVYDYSIFFFGLISVIAFVDSLYSIPKKIQKNMLKTSSENVSDAILCFDLDNNYIHGNGLGRKLYDYKSEKDREWINKYLYAPDDVMLNTEEIEVDNEIRLFNTEYRRLRDEKGRILGCYIKLNDCTIEESNRRRNIYIATHDELTGLYNRNYFFSEMEKTFINDPDTPRLLVATDIKDFKLVNDLFGTTFADNILRTQAMYMAKANYQDSIIGRISGDRFAMLISKDNFKPDLAIANTLKIRELSKNINFPLTLYLGVYEIKNAKENVHTMYDKALLAINSIFNQKDKVLAYYDDSLMTKITEEERIIREFKTALLNNELMMFLQPQIDSKTGDCLGAEALVRWYRPGIGFRQPGEFIFILERSDLIYQLDYYMWEQAAQKIREWIDRGIEDTYISVNISPKDFYYGDIYADITGLVQKYNIPPKRLNLEITESVFNGDKKEVKEILIKLHNYGFNIEMDDFGSGYSSLKNLKDLSIDVLKIDMEFLNETDNQDRSKAIISSIVKMAKKLKMLIVSEGVETIEQIEFLKSINVDIFQGYFYAKPMDVDSFEHKYIGGLK